jgi:ParB family chromosome partitioning protein
MATRHGNEIIEWYTPKKYVDLARSVMGGIDLDPASSRFAQRVVKAKKFHTAKDDGLTKAWSGRVFLNPPFKQPLGKQFTAKLCAEVRAKKVSQAVLLTNDQTDTDWWQEVASLASAVCFLDGRIGFYNEAGETSSPTNGQTFAYFGKDLAKFAKIFSTIGLCMRPIG